MWPLLMVPHRIALVVLIGIAAADRVDELSALVVAQGRQLEQVQQQLQLLSAAVAATNVIVLEPAQLGREEGAAMQDYPSSEPGRRLTAPASQRTTWHHSILHSFDNPSTCGLHAELDSVATGPMDITRSSEGNVAMGYGGAASATQPAAFEMNHPANCRTATLTSNHPLVVSGSLTTTGNLAVGGTLSLQGIDLTSKLFKRSAFAFPKYVKYLGWACSARNELGGPTTSTFTACQALCDADATCISYEFKSSTLGCTRSNSCKGSLGAAFPSTMCVPTLHMCPRLLPAFFPPLQPCARTASRRPSPVVCQLTHTLTCPIRDASRDSQSHDRLLVFVWQVGREICNGDC